MDNLLDDLLMKAKSGDARAEDELMRYLSVRFVAIAKHNIGDGEAKDIAQEACLTILQKYRTERFTKGFGAWAYGVLKMKIGNHIQGLMAKQKSSVPESEADQTQMCSSPESAYNLKRKLIDCMKKIIKHNPSYARVLNMIYQGYATNEISEKLKINQNHLYVMLNRGRGMLKSCLEKGGK
jgi:RNA polymerase sigma factor (sigma-70 family)